MSAIALRQQLPRVLIATFAVVLIPLVSVKVLEAVSGLQSPLLSVAVVVALSFAGASAGAAYWARQPGSRDLVFGDLMLWGWIRRIRTERRVAKVSRLLGLGRSGLSVLDTDLGQEQQTELLERLASSLEARDPHTHGHTQRVTRHAEMIAQRMGLPDDQVAKVRTAAALHDVGKMEIPREVLNKPGKLTDEEFEIIKRHPVVGAEMVADLGDAEMTAIVRHHHERVDGRGYPDRLSGDEIPLGARIIAVADTFDAVTSSRPYRKALSHSKAIDILKSEAGLQLDADAVTAFLAYYSGSRTASRWTFLVNAPERVATGLRDALHSTVAAPLAKNAAAVAATAVLGSSLAAPIATAMHMNESAHVSAAEAAVTNDQGESGVMQVSTDPGADASDARLTRDARAGHAEHGRHTSSTVTAGPGAGPEHRATPEHPPHPAGGPGSGQGKSNSNDKGASAPGRTSAPGNSGSAPGRNGQAKPDTPSKASPPTQGGASNGQPAQPSQPAQNAPANTPAGGNGSGNGQGTRNGGGKK